MSVDLWFLSLGSVSPLYFLGVIILLLFSAFFSMSEIVFSTCNKVRLKNMIEEKVKGSRKALYLSENFDRVLSTILVGNNIANIAIATISVRIWIAIIGDPSSGWVDFCNTFVMTIIILIFGEILPKSIGKSKAEKIAVKISGIVYATVKVLTPIVFPFYSLNKLAMRNIEEESVTVTEDELESIIDTMESEGEIEAKEADMLQRVLDLSEVEIKDIMTPRVDMVAVSVDEEVEEVKEMFFKYQFSRIPVYEDSIDNVIGIIYERDFFSKLLKNQRVNIKKIARKPIFVTNNMKADDLIQLLRNANNHIAIVVDEYGGVDGLVTMEDALEELVGEIFDEHDEVIETITKLDDNHYIVNGDLEIDNFFTELDYPERPEDIEATSVGGWIVEMLERMPKVGDHVSMEVVSRYLYDDLSADGGKEVKRLDFTVNTVKNRRITSIDLVISDVVDEHQHDKDDDKEKDE